MIPKHPRCGPQRRGYHHGGLKDALVEAARALMAEHGPAGFTLAEAVGEMAVGGLDYRTAIAKVAPTKKPRGATRRGHFGGDRQVDLDLEP